VTTAVFEQATTSRATVSSNANVSSLMARPQHSYHSGTVLQAVHPRRRHSAADLLLELDLLDHRAPFDTQQAITSHCARRCLLLRFLTFDKPETSSHNNMRLIASTTHHR
jgi:hypothetical protein